MAQQKEREGTRKGITGGDRKTTGWNYKKKPCIDGSWICLPRCSCVGMASQLNTELGMFSGKIKKNILKWNKEEKH